jgi:hypothetical protein
MSITVTCDCGLKYKVREDKRGKTFRCQGCQAEVAVPAAEANPDEEWADFGDLELEDTGAVEEDWDSVPTDLAAAPRRRKPRAEVDVESEKAGRTEGKRPLRKRESAPAKLPSKQLIILGAGGGIALLTLVLLLVVIFKGKNTGDAADSGDADSGPATGELVDPHGGAPQPGGGGGGGGGAAGGAQQPQQKPAPLPEQFTVLVADATPPEKLNSLNLLATAKPAENWSVKIAGREPPKNLGSAWYIPPEPPPTFDDLPEEYKAKINKLFKQPQTSRQKQSLTRLALTTVARDPCLLTTGTHRAAMLAVPPGPAAARLYEVDLTKPGAITKSLKLPPPGGVDVAAFQHTLSSSRRGQFWRGRSERRNPAKLRPRDRRYCVAAVNAAFTRIANGMKDNSQMQFWDGKGKLLESVDAPPGSKWAFAEFIDDNTLCLLAEDGSGKVVDATTGKPAHAAACDWRGWAAMSPDRKYVVGFNGKAIEFRDSRTLKVAGSLPLPPDLLKTKSLVGPSLDISLDGERLAAWFAANQDYVLLAWDLAAGKLTDAYMRRGYGSDLWVQWVGKRRLVIAGGSQIRHSVLDLDRKAVIYTGDNVYLHTTSVDGRIWWFGGNSDRDIQQRLYQKLTGKRPERRSRSLLPPFLFAGMAVPEPVEKSLRELKGVPVNRNIAIRVEVAGRKHWPLKETADGFAAYLSKHGFMVDPNAKVVYRLVMKYGSVRINRTGLIGPAIRGNPGVLFTASLDLGQDYRGFSADLYRGSAVLSERTGPSAPSNLGEEQWESQYPAATKKAREDYLSSIKAVMEGRSGGLRGVGTSSDRESYYLLGRSGSYSVPGGSFPVDGL